MNNPQEIRIVQEIYGAFGEITLSKRVLKNRLGGMKILKLGGLDSCRSMLISKRKTIA